MRKAAFVVAAVIVIAAVLSGCGSKIPGVPGTVATVNGESISSADYLSQVSRRFGQDMLRNMIEQRIVLQWAKKEGVLPTDDQISKQIEILKRDGSYEDQAKFLGEDGLKAEITAMQARINLAAKMIKPTDEDLKQTYDMMKQRYVHPARRQIALIINAKKSQIDEAAKKLKEGKDFDEVSAEYSNRQFSMRGPIKIWVDETQTGMPPALTSAAKETKKGEISKSFSLTPPGAPEQYAILKVIQDQPKMNKSLDQVKAEVRQATLFQKSQSDPDFSKKLNEQMKDAKIDVGISEFKDLVSQFKNPPEPPPMMAPQPRPAPPAPKPSSDKAKK